MKRAVLPVLLSLVALGCSKTPDPCGSYTGTCVAVEVRSDSEATVATLEVTLRLGDAPAARRTTTPPGGPTGFPLLFPVLADSFEGKVGVEVSAPALGLFGANSVTVAAGEHATLVVTLTGAAPDRDMAATGDNLAAADMGSSTVTSPPARFAGAAAYSPARDALVVFGGTSDRNQILGDTWEWKNGAWVESPAPSGPSARSGVSMTYDPVRKGLVLFGGTSGGTSLGDTWFYDGSGRWSRLGLAVAPPARAIGALGYSAGAGGVILAGGVVVEGDTLMLDVWELGSTSTSWSARTMVPLPGKLRGHALVTAGAALYLIGGEVAGAPQRVWFYNAAVPSWTAISPIGEAPLARRDMMAVYDPNVGAIIIHGGQAVDDSRGFDDTYALLVRDNRWVPAATGLERPAARRQAMADFEPMKQSVILFGGRAAGPIFPRGAFGDTWSMTGAKSWNLLIK